ncbi:UDP-glycosyltransferase 89B2-like [Juglans microcarpa x Juglans regia]|uniref:UDP-glycosyltransferase 89B2-like n=1 Tax=Juglans microcarpa x Juglans regia TaxID=2249226 RepID=UPI001B7DFA87|nr:UDP-glycosyltransferase 89B2-like [Juglans microcarpa x Juglans regia]
MSTNGLHIAAYPFPSSDHIIPLLDLANHLLTRGLTVTVFVTTSNLPLLQPYFSAHPSSLKRLVLPSPDITAPPQKRLIAIMRALRDLHYSILLQWFRSHSSPPVAIISDFFLGWTQDIACELGVPRLVFSPAGAFAMSVALSMCRDPPENADPDQDINFQVSFPKIPDSPAFRWWQIPGHYKSLKGDSDLEFFRNNMLANTVSWGMVFNSFIELERVYFTHLMKELRNDRVWAVGPVSPPENGDLQEYIVRGGVRSVPCHELMNWLDARPDNSVVYVCFGSRAVLTQRQIDVLTAALEQSGVQFVLCVRVPREEEQQQANADHGVIPDGFEDRMEGRGFVIRGWAPQVSILSHRAVGVFVTHCGWKSVLEGIAAGVVMLTWPMDADQYTNAMLLVEELGVAIRACEGTQNISESAELAQLLAISVEETWLERILAKELSAAAASAVKGGSSDKNLDELITQLGDLGK